MNADRRVRRTRKLLHRALISLVLEGNYDSITIQKILDRADTGRSTFYAHFKSKDELLISGIRELRDTLESAIQSERSQSKLCEAVVGFSLPMFQHASEYREVYHALLNTHGWPIFRQHLEEMFDEIIRRECKAEIQRLKKADSDVPVDLFVHYLTAGFFSVLTWWLGRRSRLTPLQIKEYPNRDYPVPHRSRDTRHLKTSVHECFCQRPSATTYVHNFSDWCAGTLQWCC